MDTDKLRYFVTIAETGSLTKASQLLGISHSGLSKAISSLEMEIKLTLFRPQGRGLEITAEGKWLYQKALDILKITEEVIRGKLAQQNSVRMGLSGIIAITCSGFIAQELPMPLLIYEIDVGELESKIVGGEVDFGIAFVPSPRPELEYLKIGKIRFNSYCREDLLNAHTISELPYAVPITDFAFNPLGYKNRDGWPRDVPRAPHFAVSGLSIALNLLRGGKAAIYMPNFVATIENEKVRSKDFKYVLVPSHKKAESTRDVFLVKTQTSEETIEMKKISKIVRKICCS